jgi:RimJ/RimL family protein N-acetyltransferase
LAKRVAQNEIFFAVAENETGVIGFCNIGQTQQGVELFRIYMLPEFIGQGIGGFLLAKGEQYLRKQGYSSYFCFVHSANEAGKRFYEKQDFHHVAERDHNADGSWRSSCLNPQVKLKRNRNESAKLIRKCSLIRSAVPPLSVSRRV